MEFVDDAWEREVLPTLRDYIAIPNVSQAYEPDWEQRGHTERALQLLYEWAQARPIAGLRVEIHRLPGRSPVLFMEIPPNGGARSGDTVLLYGHLDKQPEMTGWRDGLGPWEPVLEGDRLYGRGGADDGYSMFASLVAIEAAQRAGGAHTRCVVLIEASEESGSVDLPAHVAALSARIGTPSLVVCLDSGCNDYERLWTTTSLRGLVGGRLDVTILREGVHSGSASGVVPSTFRIARQLISRIEDERTGEVLLDAAHVDIPPDRVAQARETAETLGDATLTFPFVEGARPTTEDRVDQILGTTWRPALSVTGADGLPPSERAGNVLRPWTGLVLSLRIPPTADPDSVRATLEHTLTDNPPYGAHVTFGFEGVAPGWSAPPFAPWLERSLLDASEHVFGQGARAIGEGGTIPFMGMLGAQFPDAQFVVTGVLGPDSNAHGPNEYLHVPTAKRLTRVIAHVFRDHARR